MQLASGEYTYSRPPNKARTLQYTDALQYNHPRIIRLASGEVAHRHSYAYSAFRNAFSLLQCFLHRGASSLSSPTSFFMC